MDGKKSSSAVSAMIGRQRKREEAGLWKCFRDLIGLRRKSGNNISQRPGVRQYRPLDSLFHALEQKFSFIKIRCKGL
ncbi:hypothetical protein CHCC20331_0903 [Bacillus paralicheniformis]|nr:hypothetical protein CHCC20348_2720 [Bacillus paralicheniformis]TWK85750.1 hypothetical protein CHCC20331_0903 [Bacillus paralicheniformis]TWK91833.1 hypothetical protein CHCC20333_1423 [Bacillus paralicheniformis]